MALIPSPIIKIPRSIQVRPD
ncbi:uncharacterized protein G2W53_025265 [Senna tora]|uniref:Uncharacterized protein n=1 Tax=Senna tora TaxID=362788 RepID=A0A834TDJ9_9FABA|nr:uncharacterized protein G2W53_025265 [Senna tora]